jgi:hypothetical protein
VRSDKTWRRRRLALEEEKLSSDLRFVDYGVRIYTVRQADHGAEVLPGRPRVVASSVEQFGGVFDCRLGQWHDESAVPVVWYLSQQQRDLVIHGGPAATSDVPDQILCRGAEGAGKTSGVVAPWGIARAIEFAGQNVEIGGTAPTQARLEVLRLALAARMPPDWYVWRQRDWLFRLHCQVQIRLVSAHRGSEAEGSPIQGFDWAAHMGDEAQDQLAIMDDLQSRGRRAPGGRYRRMMSMSVKDSASCRAFELGWEAKPRLRAVKALPAFTNPFVAPEHWENLRETMDSRAYRRRVLAERVGSERKTYHDFEEASNVLPIPATAREVTHHALGVYESYARPGAVFRLLAGHDPGKIKNTTTLTRAFLFPGRLLVWMTVGEFITERTTQERHAAELRRHLQKTFGLDYPPDRLDEESGLEKTLIFRDPHSRGEQHPDDDVESAFRRHGFDIFTAAPDKQVIKRRSRIEMMNRLIKSDSGKVRFYVGCRQDGTSLAPQTLASFNDQERDDRENPETSVKGKKDITHPAVATGYSLWPFEREEIFSWTYERVLRAEGLR